MPTIPNSADELLALLIHRHSLIMDDRREKMPGQFKIKANKAGDTVFVLPEQVEGIFARAFPIYQGVAVFNGEISKYRVALSAG